MALDTTPRDLPDLDDPNRGLPDPRRTRRAALGFLLAMLMLIGLGASGAMTDVHQWFIETFPEACCGCEPC